MRSSDRRHRFTRSRAAVTVAAAFVAVACSSPPAADAPGTNEAERRPSPAAEAVDCVPDAAMTAEHRETATVWRQAVESGPFYSLSAGRSAIASCHIGVEDGAVTIEYRFDDGGSLRATRDASIEYSDQQVRFAAPPAEGATALLRRAQQSAFGDDGCGIDWARATTAPAADDPSVGETVYRGDLCNCEARIRTDAGGRPIGATFRSAC